MRDCQVNSQLNKNKKTLDHWKKSCEGMGVQSKKINSCFLLTMLMIKL